MQLSAGTYKTQQLFAANFHGAFKGKGMDATIVEALPDLQVNSYPMWTDQSHLNLPSPSNPWPCLITFVDSDIAVSDLTLRVTAYEPVSPWFYGQMVRNMEALLAITGTSSSAVSVERVAFRGAPGIRLVRSH